MSITNFLNEINEEKYPIFILLVYTDTTMAKVIKFWTGQPYSHASLSFDSGLKDLYSFGRKFKESPMTFINESLSHGILKEASDNNGLYSLYVTFVNKKEFNIMKKKLSEFKKNASNFKFSFRGLLNIALGKESHFENERFCSQFVAEILKAGVPHIINRDPSLYTPSDFRYIKNLSFVSRGKISNYDKNKVDNRINELKQKY